MVTVTAIPKDTPLPTKMLDGSRQLRLRPAAEYDNIPLASLIKWCSVYGRYGLPTRELVDWLRHYIGDKKAIEIGCGAGDLAYHLKIPGTDSKLQKDKAVALHYQNLNSPTIRYPSWVEKSEALEAVYRHKPDIVVATWVTHWVPGDRPPDNGVGCMFGVREELLLASGVTYIMIGNESVHRHKPIMSRWHETHAFPWIRSRSPHKELERIWIWQPKTG